MTRSSFGLLLTIILLSHFYTSASISLVQRFNEEDKRLASIEESIVYKALTVIEGDIMLDKFCECETKQSCQLQGRNIIRLSR